jgi:hypothetical protein
VGLVGLVDKVDREGKVVGKVVDKVMDKVVGKMNCTDYNHCRCWGRGKTFLYTYI